MNLKPTDKTALPVVLWEAHVLGEQGDIYKCSAYAMRKLKQYPFKVSSTEILFYFPLKT